MIPCRALQTLRLTKCPVGSPWDVSGRVVRAREKERTLDAIYVCRTHSKTSKNLVSKRIWRKVNNARRLSGPTTTGDIETTGHKASRRLITMREATPLRQWFSGYTASEWLLPGSTRLCNITLQTNDPITVVKSQETLLSAASGHRCKCDRIFHMFYSILV